jgi:RimJ/RimL family protein N-acetyltransferase
MPFYPRVHFARLETPRLVLRPFEERDILPFAAYRSDPEVARYQGWETPYSPERAARFVAEMIRARPGTPGEWYQAAIELKAGEEMIGDCAFCVSADGRQAEIGYTLARRFQGQGYASEALTRLLDYLFFDLNLHRVHANLDPQNTPSARLLERLGFRLEGRFVESLWFKGGWADEAWYAILQREWLARHRRTP